MARAREARRRRRPGKYRRRSREEIDSLLERFHSSGLTQLAFAKQHELSVSTLHYWLRQYRQAERVASEARFLPVAVSDVVEVSDCALELDLGNERRLHIPSAIDREVLANLLPVIVGTC